MRKQPLPVRAICRELHTAVAWRAHTPPGAPRSPRRDHAPSQLSEPGADTRRSTHRRALDRETEPEVHRDFARTLRGAQTRALDGQVRGRYQ